MTILPCFLSNLGRTIVGSGVASSTTHQICKNTENPPLRYLAKGLILGVAMFAILSNPASANLTVDLRATSLTGSGSISNLGKSVSGFASGDVITMQVWAEITTLSGTGDYGLQTLQGSVITSGGNLTGITGTMSTATLSAPYNSGGRNGVVAELTSPSDNSPDLGAVGTAPSTNFPLFRTDPSDASGGVYTGSANHYQTSGTHGASLVLGTNYSPVTVGGQLGFQFLLGTATFTIGQANSSSSMSLNWVIPGFTTPANKGTIAVWVEANTVSNGSTNFAEMLVGSPITLTSVPEPATLGMILLGAVSLLSYRKMVARKT